MRAEEAPIVGEETFTSIEDAEEKVTEEEVGVIMANVGEDNMRALKPSPNPPKKEMGQSSTGGEEEVDITRDEAMDTEGGDIRETTEKERAGLEAGVETDEARDAAGAVDEATASRTTLRTRRAGTTRYSTSEELLYLHHGTTYL